MRHPNPHGTIEVICGSMFSGKTEELLRRVKRAQIARQKVQVFKPAMDNRYSVDHVESHNANRAPSVVVEKAEDILSFIDDKTRVVGIDEAQFFNEGIIMVAQKLADRGINVIVAGLDMDYLSLPFGPMPQLMAIAENVTKLSAVCVVCGGTASRTQKTHSGKERSRELLSVGGREMYEARCRACHDPELLESKSIQTSLDC
ncbi:MAG: thymidine kinase [Pseudomonadota bacterium]|nr:thymidine kinase [Pseudomonadota bacterium]